MSTYSFLDNNAAIVGPGGSVNLANGAASAEEGITFAPNDDIGGMVVGGDGAVMHSLYANRSGTATVRLLKTSPVNQKLMLMANYQRSAGALHGQNTINLTNANTQDVISCTQVGFKRVPDLNYAKDGGIVEWTFNVGVMDPTLGAVT